ncbi:MAG: hypothetical protein KF782_02750 [Labilithrix sp.]|nr:hypothetical protein [Labilithrix sp.]
MTPARALALTLGTLALGLAPLALAEPAPAKPPAKPPASAPPPAPPPPPVHASAIVHIATEIAKGLGDVPPGALVAVSPLVSDVPAPKADELVVRVGAQIAGRLGVAQAHPQPATLAAARGVSGRAASLVYVQLEIAKGELRATADLYPVVSNGWERLRNPAPGPRAHAFAGAPLDAEVRTFLQPIVLEQAKLHKAKHEETDVLAIGCGDVDSDGGNEIILATRARVVMGKLRGGKLAVYRATPWTELASRVPVPMREPIASVVVPRGHRGELLVGMTDRGAVAVDAALVTRRQLTGLPIPGADGDACAAASPEVGAFEGSGVACAPPAKGEPAPVLPLPAARFDAVASLDLVGKDGAITQVVAAREPTGKVRLRRSDASGKSMEAPIDGAGAQIALADLDLDGTPEIAFSGDNAETDVVAVWSWRAGSGLVQRLRYPTKEPVRAIAACPPEEKGLPALVAVVGGEVWLVR